MGEGNNKIEVKKGQIKRKKFQEIKAYKVNF